jgi:hypothetical protein
MEEGYQESRCTNLCWCKQAKCTLQLFLNLSKVNIKDPWLHALESLMGITNMRLLLGVCMVFKFFEEHIMIGDPLTKKLYEVAECSIGWKYCVTWSQSSIFDGYEDIANILCLKEMD